MSGSESDEAREIARKARRREEARKREDESAWFGVGMFGMVGWAVAVPALAGTALGIWIDSRWPGAMSWTLVGLFAGVGLGCLNAWFWIRREGRGDD